jgi:hypothetical protein
LDLATREALIHCSSNWLLVAVAHALPSPAIVEIAPPNVGVRILLSSASAM